ncbi:hypothetical protein HMPREF1142_0447 [Peptostreptococcaceae bacterium AS15]|nr:hypothetical protein HMPREF1142_0447 [Peptostreptococcaceae bacterium AS15]
MSKLRIDTGSIGYTSDFLRQQNGKELGTSANTGENIKGRVIDVNQSTVLIQTPSGGQITATSLIPMENFINREMNFDLIVGENGELILSPQIDDKIENNLKQIKIQDILAKLGKDINSSNREIIENMISSSIPISKENFESVKELKFALEILKGEDFAVELEENEQSQDLMSVLKDIQNKKDFGIAKKSDSPVLSKDVSLKDLLLLKNLDVKISPDNVKALETLMKNISDKKTDIADMSKLIEDFQNLEDFIFESTAFVSKTDALNEKADLKNIEFLLENAENLSIEDMEELNSQFKDVIFEEFDEDISNFENKKIINESANDIIAKDKITKDEVINTLREVQNRAVKTINVEKNAARENLKIDYNQLKEEVKTLSNMTQNRSQTLNIAEKQLISKLDILANMAEKYNYNIIPFKTEQDYENILQYYVKKDNKSLKKQDDINVGLSLDTINNGNVKAMVNYNTNNNLKLEFFTEDKKVKSLFENNMSSLTEILKKLGFSDVDVNVRVKTSKETLMQEALYDDNLAKSLEFYV